MKAHTLTASSFGNILEWFDFGLFIYLAPIIGAQFFPTSNTYTATLAAFGVFAAGFICRPLGGILFGHWGDKKGRANTLRWSILCISLATLFVGLLPGYHSIGIAAAILFTLLRLLQGLSVGGEYGGVMVYLSESAEKPRRGFFASFGVMGANGGFLLATLTAIVLNTFVPMSVLEAGAWRIPFILAGFVGFFMLYHRLKLLETPAYLSLKKTAQIPTQPLLTAMREVPGTLLKIIGMTCMGSTLYFVFFGYMPTYLAQHTQTSFLQALSFQAVLLAVMMAFIPLAGFLGDRLGRKKMLLIAASGIIVFTLPCFYGLTSEIGLFIFAALSIVTILSALEQGNTLTAAVENLPPAVRYSGVCFSYNLGNALFGGTAPLVVSLLAQDVGVFAPAYYLMGMAGVSLIAIGCLKN